MSYLSLQKAVRTSRVDGSWADKIYSTRFLDACEVVCPVHSGVDQYGRVVHPDTLMLETAGCRSASSRVDVENAVVRPQYFSLVSLDNYGVAGDLNSEDAANRTNDLRGLHTIVGSTGQDYGANIRTRVGRDTFREFDRGMIN